MNKGDYGDLFVFIFFLLGISAMISIAVLVLNQYLGYTGFVISILIIAIVLFLLPIELTRGID